MRLIAGLGNPGADYAMTRHNMGFMVVDALAAELGVSYWKDQDGCKVGICKLDGEELLLVKPQAFMNRSGGPLSHVMARHEIEPADILVVHDDLDLPEFTLRFKRKGGHGGHNGLRSINDAIGNEYARLKMGIGRPPGRMDPADFVLAPIPKKLQEDVASHAATGAEAALLAARQGLDAAMQRYNGEQS